MLVLLLLLVLLMLMLLLLRPPCQHFDTFTCPAPAIFPQLCLACFFVGEATNSKQVPAWD